MKFSASFVASVILATTAYAAPTWKRASPTTMTMGKANGQAIGAAYFITNDPSGNFVVSADIGSDGKLTLRQATSTGGVGAHGQTSPIGPDALFSQGSVKASAASNLLAAVNPGSNTLAVFKIDPNNPSAITMLGSPVGTGGDFPISLAFNKAGNTVCALNGGSANGVNCFKVDQKLGPLPLANTNRALNINQTTPATGPAGSLSHVIFNEDNTQLLAAVKGTPNVTVGFIAVWDIASDGSLSSQFQAVQPANGGGLPFSLTVIPGQNAVLATDPAIGFDVFDFNSSNSSSANKINGQGATCWSSFSNKTGNFYLTDVVTAEVTEVNVDQNLKATVVTQYQQANGSATIDNDVASVGSNDFLYVLAPGKTSMDVLSLNAPGKATELQSVDVAGPAKAAGLTLNGNNMQGMTTFIKK